jgi:hypothetical protein
VVELDQLRHRRFFTDVPFPGAPGGSDRTVRLSGTGVLVDGDPLHATGPAPLLGEHNGRLTHILARWQARSTGADRLGADGVRVGTWAATDEEHR